jgi:hypothetical protein
VAPSAGCASATESAAGSSGVMRAVRFGEPSPSRNSRPRRKPSSLEVSPPAIAAAFAPALPRAPLAAASALSHEAGMSAPPSRTIGVVMRSSTWTCWKA